MRTSIIMAGLVGAIIVGNAPAIIAEAHADDTSYLAAVGGIYHLWSPDQMLHLGHGICDELRKGRTAEQQIALAPAMMPLDVDVPGVVYAAQRELCPTLGH